MLEHLSIFIENKPGKLNRIMQLLGESKLNVRAYSIADAGACGVLKLLVDQPTKAAQLLADNRIIVTKRNILLVVIKDEPGSLFQLLNLLSEHQVNVSDSYGFLLPGNHAAIVLECDHYEHAEQVIRAQGLTLLDNPADLVVK